MASFLDPVKGFGLTFATMFRKATTEQYPEEITLDQLMASMMFDPSTGETPSPDMLDPNQLMPVGWAGVQSTGTTQWVTMDLTAGQVVLICFVTDPAAGEVPHAFEGMTQIFPVAEG